MQERTLFSEADLVGGGGGGGEGMLRGIWSNRKNKNG